MSSPSRSPIDAAVVPAAGEGTRLRPLTEDRPKPLVEVAGRPLLAHVLDALAPADPGRYVVVTGYRGEQIEAAFGEAYDGTPIEYVRQPDPCGLADAVGRAESVVEGLLLVCNGDNVLGDDLAPLASTFASAGDDVAATMLVEETTVEAARETGVVVTEGRATQARVASERERQRVERVVEKPDDPPTTLVSAGAYAFSPPIFEACAAIDPAPTGEYELADAITWLIERGHAVEAIRYGGERVNVNTEADLERAASIAGSR